MEQAEIEVAVGELETRMDRLRALYDQYFMGIERLEPLVPRKDVERRMAILRKEQIRNTGLRYKFNMLIQRFNTNQTYWVRIARQIENGTYKRDIARATARFGVDPAKERVAEPSGPPPAKERTAEREAPSSAPRIYIPDEPAEEISSAHAEEDPFAAMGHAVVAVPRERFASSLRLGIDDLGEPLQEDDPFPKPASGPKIRPRAPAPPPGPGTSDARITIAKRASVPDPAEVVPPPPPSRPGAAAPPPSRPGAPPPLPAAASAQKPGTLPRAVPVPQTLTGGKPVVVTEVQRRMTLPGPGAPPPLVQGQPPAVPGIARRDAPTLNSRAAPTPLEIQRRMTLPDGAPPPARAAAAPPPPPAVARRPDAPPAAPPSAPQISVSVPASLSSSRVAVVRAPEIQRMPVTAPRSAAPQPPPVARPVASAAPPSAAQSAPAIPARTGGLSGDRIDQIYSKYVETRRAHNEPTHAITREALAKQLTDSSERLKQKHGGKSIDFEVVVKDGKTTLKPVVK